ncbi:MAG: DUF4440 domain-containing protein [Alphaproteobacteria bacterium]|nr:DUF4440 domain-containing protein [Alphaproteobacteria bacterium]
MTSLASRTPFIAAFAAMTLCLAIAACSPKAATPAGEDSAPATADRNEAIVKDVMKVDQAFSDMAQKDGVGAAFLAYMDPMEGEMIQPGEIVNGSDAIRKAFANWPANQTLVWSPDDGYASQSGDLAVTTGPYQQKVDGVTRGTGRYVTVWRKDAAGEWKGLMDLGVPDPGLAVPPGQQSSPATSPAEPKPQ